MGNEGLDACRYCHETRGTEWLLDAIENRKQGSRRLSVSSGNEGYCSEGWRQERMGKEGLERQKKDIIKVWAETFARMGNEGRRG